MISTLISQFGYLAVFLGVLLESAGIPIPGETILILAGVAAGQGRLNLETAIALGVAGAVVGDQVGYWIGRRRGRDFLLRHGRIFRVTPERIDRVESFFDRHGGKAVFLARFVAGLRVFGAFAAGVSRMRWRTFFTYNILGALTWATGAVLAGYLLGNSYHLAERWIGKASILLLVTGAVVLVAYIAHRRALAKGWYGRIAIADRLRGNRAATAVARRFRPHTTFGLSLTLGIVAIVACSWLFAGIAQDVAAGDPLVRLDHQLLRTVHQHADKELTATVDVMELVLAPELLLLLGFAVGAALALRHRYASGRHGMLGVLLLVNTTGCGVLIEGFKHLIHRARPPASLQLAVPRIDGYGFPSGHALVATSLSMVTWFALARIGVRGVDTIAGKARVGFLLGTIVLLVGLGRIYTGAHYPSDVVGGWMLGAAWASICIVGTSLLLEINGESLPER